MTARQPHQQPVIELKCWTPSFKALKDGTKRFEFRKDDRPYAVGVTVKQKEWNPDTEYTGDYLYHDITFIIRGGIFGIPEGYCIFSTTEPRNTQEATHTPAAPAERLCDECDILEVEQKVTDLEQQVKDEREQVLDALSDPMQGLLLAIGRTHDECMKLPGDYNAELGESIQVCFDKFVILRKKIEESLRGKP